MSVVLVAGVSRYLGGRLAAQLAADPGVERVIGIDTIAPRPDDVPLLGRTEFVRADIRNPLIAKVITQARVTTVVHSALTASPHAVGGRVPMQELNVIGTMQLLAACQKSDTVQRFVLRSTTAVYGAGPGEPAVLTERDLPVDTVHTAYARDAIEVEGYLRGFARRRPDVDITVLRLAGVIGPTIDSALTRYLSRPVVPSPLGFDPRLQLLHEVDAVETLRLAAVTSRPGVVNVAGAGVLPLSQLLRRAGHLRLPVPAPVLELTGRVVGNRSVREVVGEGAHYLHHGRVVDTTALRTVFGYTPHYSTAAAVESFLAARRAPAPVTRLTLGVGSLLARARPSRAQGDRWAT